MGIPTMIDTHAAPDRSVGGYALPVVDEDAVRRLSAALGLSRVTAHLLVSRGVATVDAAERFLAPSLERDWEDPRVIPGIDEVADLVDWALGSGSRICVLGDFDADGVSATAVMVRALRRLGGEVFAIIPRRLGEGYGLSPAVIERIVEREPDLVITVDNGIAAADEVILLQERGIRVAVTDHHEPADSVPQGVPVADPKLDEGCPSRELAGVGVALKLVQLLGERHGTPGLWREYLDLATLGTIGDQMVLQGENRALVAAGTRMMEERPSFAISAFKAVYPREAKLTADALAFSLLPRINSAGRMGDAMLALDLLLADNMVDAMDAMTRLEEANDARRAMEAELTGKVDAEIERTYRGQRAIVAGGEDWHEGVKGIVASRIVGRYRVPTLLFSIQDGMAFGSGRSVGKVDLFHAVESCSDMLVRFGGHEAAVGITLESSRLDEFRDRLCAVLDELPASDFEVPRTVDMEVSLSEVDIPIIDEVGILAPFGQGNPVPRYLVRSVLMENRRAQGRPPVHFSCTAVDGVAEVRGIYFRPDDLDALIDCDRAVDIVFGAERNEYRGNVTPQLMIKDIVLPEAPVVAESHMTAAFELVSELFARSEEFLDRSDYAGILDARSFHTKVAGVTFEGRQEVLRVLTAPADLRLVREPGNAHDGNAIAVVAAAGQIGYLNARLSARLAPAMDAGETYRAVLEERTGDGGERSFGANILVRKGDDEEDGVLDVMQVRAMRDSLAACDDAILLERLREGFIGPYGLHEAQSAALDALGAGRSVLCVMATGRGKSLIFQIHAARTALRQRRASVFVYPLRALVADQAFHLQERFMQFGLDVRVLTGESSAAERASVFEALAEGLVDCILTTPEFLTIHADRFARAGRVGFLVIDEAHHIADAHRPAYMAVREARQAMGDPVVLACTATADDTTARAIVDTCGIDEVVCDPSVRENLAVVDQRNLKRRDAYLARLVDTGGKTVVYVNSREQAASIARTLRKRLPSHASQVAFYHAGIPKGDRLKVERAFRDGVLQAIVSTSAFGEGVNIPDIRNVVLYHLPFDGVEFNQMAGRAGRDGQEAHVHLLYGKDDVVINERILESTAPGRDELVSLYRALRQLAAETGYGEDGFQVSNAGLVERCRRIDSKSKLGESGVSSGIAVFRELGFLETRGYGSARRIVLVEHPPRMELAQSARYLEGRGALEAFAGFRRWAFDSSPDEVLRHFNRPILPGSQGAEGE